MAEKTDSFLQEKIPPGKEALQPAKVIEKGSVHGDSGSYRGTSQSLEALSKQSAGTNLEKKKDIDDETDKTSWWLGGGGVHYGGRD